MVSEFKRTSIPYLDFEPADEWDWLALAQHHGLATRLLDWTENPLAGLWFAVREEAEEGGYGVVWVLPVQEADLVVPGRRSNPYAGKWTKVFEPKHITRRIEAQAGWFTVHKYVSSRSKFIPLKSNDRYTKRLIRLRIPSSAFPRLREELEYCGINDAALFPGLDGLCRHINWKYSPPEDEQREQPCEE
jgi:hypothetical protein